MIKQLKILDHNFSFVFRYRYDTDNKLFDTMWKDWRLGIMFRRVEIVGKNYFSDVSKWKNNLVYSYTFGFDLLWWKMWVDYHKGGMNLEVK